MMKVLIKMLLFGLVIIPVCTNSLWAQNSRGKHILVTPAKAERILKKQFVEVLDVRTKAEVDAGHLPNARNIDFKNEEFATLVSKLPRDKTYLIYCRTGVRSSKAAEVMQMAGFKKVYEIKGGITAYNDYKRRQKK